MYISYDWSEKMRTFPLFSHYIIECCKSARHTNISIADVLIKLLFNYSETPSPRLFNFHQWAAPVAEWLRSLTSVLLIIRPSHRCGFAPRSGHESHVGQVKFCLRVCQLVFPRVLRFSPHLPIDSSRYE